MAVTSTSLLIKFGRIANSLASTLPSKRSTRNFFHWKHSGGPIVGLWAAVPALVAIGQAIHHNSGPIFTTACLCAGCAWVYSLGSWTTSGYLAKRKLVPTRAQRRRKSFPSQSSYLLLKYGVCFAISLPFIASICFIRFVDFQKQIEAADGWLVPGSAPSPPDTCSYPPDSFVFHFGDSEVLIDSFPHTVIQTIGGPRLVVDRDNHNRLALTLDVYGQDGRLVGRIEKNRFLVNQNNVLSIERESLSDLKLVDQYGRQALNVRYLNPQSMVLTALLFYPDSPPISIGAAGTQIGRETLNRACIDSRAVRFGDIFPLPAGR